ncbi:MAG: hypothetical protein COX77_01120 [Candidatus Komeilibacteria bacterium CG_4_10_14_0_2_um_filter_37_10]|uniref:Response regulatory domain-containing protein n=1 Tax=Candidatus Komeilibacteria bacterium CG_4_10_14_0_2_um_filter_37_10 TaxID=1974470 RepID=A0A2M7VG26_9BACT|nr:MAG: hypothetical protein COX77_01120 [Candidatus Komeilibacteria bacterium CG_4_10_14_0_2_um_filter_37_10]PJA92574.1 MAG: hypothetical protein CO133_02455 [Candidatus Komeilibacteria bacterium CG_4_9_14_3_um_filter_37_5]
MLILVVENELAQIEIAKRELNGLGFRVAIARTLADAHRLMMVLQSALKGIITDLHFPETNEDLMVDKTSDQPNGLAVIAEAVVHNIPVAVCSDINHHFCAYAKNVIAMMATHQNYSPHIIPFKMDKKNWHQAGEELKNLIQK